MTLPQVGRYHAVTSPDGPEPEYFDPGLPGLEAAMRAAEEGFPGRRAAGRHLGLRPGRHARLHDHQGGGGLAAG